MWLLYAILGSTAIISTQLTTITNFIGSDLLNFTGFFDMLVNVICLLFMFKIYQKWYQKLFCCCIKCCQVSQKHKNTTNQMVQLQVDSTPTSTETTSG